MATGMLIKLATVILYMTYIFIKAIIKELVIPIIILIKKGIDSIK